MSRIEIVSIKPHSDGDPSQRPSFPWTPLNPPTIYLEKIGALWMEKRGEAKPGVRYYLEQLPSGYALFERARANSKIVDKRLYGHPKKYFDSPNRFFPHFEHLMTKGTSQGCPCTICNSTGSGVLPIGRPAARKSQNIPRPAPALAKVSRAMDEELTPDTIRQCIDRLKLVGELDQPIEEKLSMDWRAERSLLRDTLDKLAKQKSWLHRVGELVLFIRDENGEIFLDDVSQSHKLVQGDKVTTPDWEAGVVGQVPEEGIKMDDIVVETTKSHGLAYSGYRVEPLPDPNGKDKSLGRKYKYVPLHHIRPFVFWQEFLRGIPKENWNPTVYNALKVMGSMSLVDRFRFKGTWPSATIFCRGIYIGSELICLGDTVRIVPAEDTVRDVLHVESIRLLLSNLDKAGDNDDDQGHPYNITVHLCGKAYTLDAHRSWTPTPIARAHPGMEGYDDWYFLHDPAKSYRLGFTSVLGRCFEANPMLLWFPSPSPNTSTTTSHTTLTHGLSGVLTARAISATQDRRILPGKSWFWGDSRAETLDIASLNNVDVSYHDAERDEERLEEWTKAAKVLDKTASKDEQAALVRKVMSHRIAATNAGAETGGGAMRAAAAVVTVGTETPADDDEDDHADDEREGNDVEEPGTNEDEEEKSSSDSIIITTSHTHPSISVSIPQIPRKRPLSIATATSSRDELDPDTAFYSLDEWVKPVATSTSQSIAVTIPTPSTARPHAPANQAAKRVKSTHTPTPSRYGNSVESAMSDQLGRAPASRSGSRASTSTTGEADEGLLAAFRLDGRGGGVGKGERGKG